MRAAFLTALFVVSALGAALLVRAITDLIPDSPPPTRSIDITVDPPTPPTTGDRGG